MNKNLYFPMYLTQSYPVTEETLITPFVAICNKQPNPVAVVFSGGRMTAMDANVGELTIGEVSRISG